MTTNTGGPASEKTLRDEFAGQALAGLCSSWYDRHKDDPLTQRGHGPTLISQSAYTHAEAMLAEKARRENPPTERISIGSDDQRKALEALRLIQDIDHPEFAAVRLSIANLASRFKVTGEAVVKEYSTTQDAGKMVWKQSPNMGSAIVCETQFSDEHADDENVKAYGGYLVAESVPEEAKAIIIRAPQLEAANKELVEALDALLGSNPTTSLCMHEGEDSFGRVMGTWGAKAEEKARTILAKHKGAA